MGVTAIHDVVVASSRLARGDAPLTLGVDMHFAYLLSSVRRWQTAVAAGNARRATAFGGGLRDVVRNGTVFAAAISEPGQDLTRPSTTATRTADGWVVSGRKIFCTMSPAADVLYTAVTYADGESESYGYALVPRNAPGVTVHGDWDALGMRASGSHSVSFDDVELPQSALRKGFPIGDSAEYMERMLNGGLLHSAVALGVAESAVEHANGPLRRRDELDARTKMLAAENVVDLAACRGVLSRAADLLDEQHRRHPAERLPREDLTAIFAEIQSAKAFIGDVAVRIVDRTLALSGGGGYMSASPLARAYRDVRATAFMHPLGANRGYLFLADIAAGRDPQLH
jgi:alkylation response protein AidB-like acyl-CoA dehydrogenase